MEIKNILIVKLSAIGDVIHALPVAYALKKNFPQARITWVVEPPAYDLLTDNPYIDDIIVFEKKKFKSLGGLIKNLPSFSASLKKVKYDIALDLQGLGKSAIVAFLSGAKVKYGCYNMRECSDFISKPICGPNADGHIVERYLDVARAVGCMVDEAVFPVHVMDKDADLAERIMRQAGMDPANPYVVLAIGANWPNKRWPTQYYAALSDWLYARQVIPVAIGGGAVDSRLIAEINAKTVIPPIDLVGKTNLKQLAHIIAQARALVGGDTGPMHLAAGLNKPVVALFGPTDIRRNGPYGQAENALEITAACKHCWKRSCPQGKDCLAEIIPAQVIEKLRRLLAESKQNSGK